MASSRTKPISVSLIAMYFSCSRLSCSLSSHLCSALSFECAGNTPLRIFFSSTFPNFCSEVSFFFFSSVKVVHAFHALDDFLIFWFVRPVLLSQFCLAGLRHCLMDLGASTGVSAFLMVCGIIPHTLYTQSFAFFALVSQFLDQNTVSPPFSHFGRGRGLEKKKTSWFTSASSLFLTKHGFTNGISGRPQKKRERDLADEELRGSHVLITIPFHATS